MQKEILEKHPHPQRLWDFPEAEKMVEQFRARDFWTGKGMYAFVCWQWVSPLADWIGKRKVLEVMAGAGWLAKALREKGVEIIATDNNQWQNKFNWEHVTEVIQLEARTAITKYGKEADILIISWPYMDDDAYHAIKWMRKVNPTAVIVYIGEGKGGCTASNKFFEHFREIEDEVFNHIAGKYETWFGLHDRIYLGQYTPC